jgi:hypothetical protein
MSDFLRDGRTGKRPHTLSLFKAQLTVVSRKYFSLSKEDPKRKSYRRNIMSGLGFLIPMSITAGVSVCFSLSVVLTLVIFRELRHQPFMQIIAFISVSDLLGNIAYVPPERPNDGTPLCSFECFLNDSCYPSSWLWTTVLVINLYQMAMEKKAPVLNYQTHFVCWFVPIVLFFISVPFSSFKTITNHPFEVCAANGEIVDIYHSITYYGMFFISFFVMLFYQNKITQLEKSSFPGVNEPAFVVAKAALRFYPWSLFLCWIPHVFIIFLYYFGCGGSGFNIAYYLADLLKMIHGAVTAVIFFYYSPEARRLWKKWFHGTYHTIQQKKRRTVDERTVSEDLEGVVTTENILQQMKASVDSSKTNSRASSADSGQTTNSYADRAFERIQLNSMN